MPAPVITPVVTGTAPNQTIDLGNYTSQVNAGVSRAWASGQLQPDVATGRAAVADGDEFQVLVGDEYVRYRRDSSATQTEVARYPSAARVSAIRAQSDRNKRLVTGTLVATNQLFDVNATDLEPGRFIAPANGSSSVNASYTASGMIDVSGASVFFVRGGGNDFYAWYNENGSYHSTGGRAGNVYTKPAGVFGLRFSIQLAAISPNDVYVAVGDQPVAWEPYGGKVNVAGIAGLPGTALAEGAIDPDRTNFLLPNKNKFDKFTALPGQYSAAGVFAATDIYTYSTRPIRVTPGQPYVCNVGIRFLNARDATGASITAAGTNTQIPAGTVIIPPEGVSYYIITLANASVPNCQFEDGTVSTGYVEFGYSLDPRVSVQASTGLSAWTDKRVGFYGDSLSAQGEFITPTVSQFGIVSVNRGVGGSRVSGSSLSDAMWQAARLDLIPADLDALHFLGGTNDWMQNAAIGVITDTTPATFYGALNIVAAEFKTRFPLYKIFWGTVPLSRAEFPRTGFIDPYTNGQGDIEAYNNAIRAVAHRNGFSLVDYYREAGFHTGNIELYMKPESSLLHPNTLGGKRMSSVLNGRMRSLEPVA